MIRTSKEQETETVCLFELELTIYSCNQHLFPIINYFVMLQITLEL